MPFLRPAAAPLRRAIRFKQPFTTSSSSLSGHNKWSKIRHNKGTQDAKKSALNGKAHRDIVVAVRGGSGVDTDTNTTLAAVLKRAKAQGVPKQTIESALKKAVGDTGKGSQYMTFEAMANGSIGVMVECLTDNINRTLHTLRDIISTAGARPAPVGFMFQRKGCVRVLVDKGDGFDTRLEKLIEAALEAEAEDFEQSDPEESSNTVEVEFVCLPATLAKVTAAVTAPYMSRELISSELIYKAADDSVAGSSGEDSLDAVSRLVERLEADEDVLRVWTTLDW